MVADVLDHRSEVRVRPALGRWIGALATRVTANSELPGAAQEFRWTVDRHCRQVQEVDHSSDRAAQGTTGKLELFLYGAWRCHYVYRSPVSAFEASFV
jgi:hypothetical protein